MQLKATSKAPLIDQRKDQNETRVTWKNSLLFTTCCISNTVGLGNVWRFPHKASQNGGGAFLISYIFITMVIGIPLYYLEIILGQFSSKPSTEAFKALAPGLSGVGWCQALVSLSISTYYGALTTYMGFYFLQSFSIVLPWTVCRSEWGESCTSLSNFTRISNQNYLLSEELYFFKEVLRLQPREVLHGGVGTPNMTMVACSFVTWIIIFAPLSRQLVGKFSYFMAYFPYVILLILVAKTSQFKGAYEGIWYLFKPDWSKMPFYEVWYQATVQSFISLTQGLGVITTYASFNKFNYPAKTISVAVVTVDVLTSLLFGITNFAALGHLAWRLNVTVDEVSSNGPSMVFIAYPQAFASNISVPQLYSAMFFFMLIVIFIGSIHGLQVVVINHLKYCFPGLKFWTYALASAGLCFGISIIYFTPGGYYLMDLISDYGGDMVNCVLVTVTLIAVNYCYGLQNFCWDVEFMSQTKVNSFWRISWALVDTTIMSLATVYTFANSPNEGFSTSYKVYSWLICVGVLLPIPITIWYTSTKYDMGCAGNLQKTFTSENWRPYDEKDCKEWNRLKTIAKMQGDPDKDNYFMKLGTLENSDADLPRSNFPPAVGIQHGPVHERMMPKVCAQEIHIPVIMNNKT